MYTSESESEDYSDAQEPPQDLEKSDKEVAELSHRLDNLCTSNTSPVLNSCQKDVWEDAVQGSSTRGQDSEDVLDANPVEAKGDSAAKACEIEEEARKAEEEKLSIEEAEDRKDKSMLLKDEGNECFKNSVVSLALEKYTEALSICPIRYSKERSVLFSNRAACHMKLDAPESALADCDAALRLQPEYVRCLQRRACLLEDKDRLTEALEDYKLLVQLDPGNQKARWACMTLPDRIKAQQEKMKEEMLGQLKQLGNMVLKPFGLSTDNFKLTKNPDSEGYSINFSR